LPGEEKRLTLALVNETQGDPRETNAGSAADCWTKNGLSEHLQQDVWRRGANRAAGPDLAGAIANANPRNSKNAQ
jgi:hypothetical protein